MNKRPVIQVIAVNLVLVAFTVGIGTANADSKAATNNTPRILKKSKQVGEVVLGLRAEAALNKFDPLFRIFNSSVYISSVQDMYKDHSENETPMGIVGDFNGDKIDDIALMGQTHNEQIVIVLISNKDKYDVVELERSEYVDPKKSLYPPKSDDQNDSEDGDVEPEQGLFTYLSVFRANDPEKTIMEKKKYKFDAIQIENFRGPTRLFYYKNGRFVDVAG